ncbi:hypothetical protein N7539_000719 [Penicillium diatomitis]|uniref:Integrase zinc-binding domain-containing protein n=1 Tax=Penicillium diatomitis TaxID=2819901 RepID=A0A9W9XM98_9EURO|nr:uncharacterized protein N7539_000719 [Penicillium diatomitis]KAJ5495603.1 hypothetical protein N7539_000719 [Penicillium diatomitis]
MSNYSRRPDTNDSYGLMNPPMNVPNPYTHPDSSHHDFGTAASSASYHFPSHSYNPYGSQFSSPYGQQATLSPGIQHLQYASDQTISSMSMVDDLRLHSHHHAHQHQHQHSHSQSHAPSQYMAQSRYMQTPRYLPLRDALSETEIESQESRNEGTMLSEPVVPALDGFPDVKEFDQLMQSYVDDLSVKKQDKALIHSKRARNIRTVLIDPKDTAVESAQFRFWVKKMFKLQTVGIGNTDCRKMICHEGKPVAIREKLFKILTRAHQQCQHGGRDKTSAQVRRIYSWVPKELISRFVKICPTCQVRRGGSRLTPPNSRRGSPRLELIPRSPKLPSPPIVKRDSSSSYGAHTTAPGAGARTGTGTVTPTQSDYMGQYHSHSHSHGHNAWIDSSSQNLQSRSAVALRSYPAGSGLNPTHHSHSMAQGLDPFAEDMALTPSQLGYATGYVPSHHGESGHREY